jgi:regulator of PEP synthase PpsR (kinase-PPPase family)
MVEKPRPVFVLSDGTGDTGEKVVRAVLKQFTGYLVHLQVFPEVTGAHEIEQIVHLAARGGALLVTTFVQANMRAVAETLAKQHRVPTVDLLAPLLGTFEDYLNTQPAEVPGRLHQADADYFRRVEAVEFTIKADDGKEPGLLHQADVVLIGISRTSKTPLSVFMAYKGFKVSNVPIVLNRPLPPTVFNLDQQRIFGLTIDPDSLAAIRQQRLATMRVGVRSDYGEMGHIYEELDWSERLFRSRPTWPVIDVTGRAVEETASVILKIMGERGIGREVGEVGQL